MARSAAVSDGFSALQRAEIAEIIRTFVLLPCYIQFQCSSASRKFLNAPPARRGYGYVAFQCSSASRKFLNAGEVRYGDSVDEFQCSSASRKFLNASPGKPAPRPRRFQCSSASRKFLNVRSTVTTCLWIRRFSALQRAENSSIPTLAPASIHISDRDDHASSFLSLPGASP